MAWSEPTVDARDLHDSLCVAVDRLSGTLDRLNPMCLYQDQATLVALQDARALLAQAEQLLGNLLLPR